VATTEKGERKRTADIASSTNNEDFRHCELVLGVGWLLCLKAVLLITEEDPGLFEAVAGSLISIRTVCRP